MFTLTRDTARLSGRGSSRAHPDAVGNAHSLRYAASDSAACAAARRAIGTRKGEQLS